MGLLDGIKNVLRKKKKKIKVDEKIVTQHHGKYPSDIPCAVCGGVGVDKYKFGMYWHRKCLRWNTKKHKHLSVS